MYEKDGWPMYSWYDKAAIYFFCFAMTLGWRVVNLGRWIVETAGRVRERHYPTASGTV